VAEGVAVEKDVLSHDASLRAGEEIETDFPIESGGIEIIGPGQRRTDPDGAIIGLQPFTDPQQAADIAVGS